MNNETNVNISLNGGIGEAFRKTCKVLLHEEIGELSEFEAFLKRYSTGLMETRSGLSGKKIACSEPYCGEARFLSYLEAPTVKIEPFGINEIKDIDSLFLAASERFWYAGNKVLGNSRDVLESDNCFDSVGIFRSKHIWNVKYAAYCDMVNFSEYMFGCTHGGEGNSFCMNSSWVSSAIRCFEAGMPIKTSDAYYSHNCNGCREVMFCFNQHSKTNAIGNVQLPKDKYFALKEKILAEIAGILKREKTAPSLVDICSGGW